MKSDEDFVIETLRELVEKALYEHILPPFYEKGLLGKKKVVKIDIVLDDLDVQDSLKAMELKPPFRRVRKIRPKNRTRNKEEK